MLFYYMYRHLPTYVTVLCACLVPMEAKRVLSSLEVELETVVSHHMLAWEANPDPLQEQPVLLTAEPTL